MYVIPETKMPVDDLKDDDQHLMHLVMSRGDVQAYKQLYEKYSPIVLGFSYRLVHHRGLAEEITQETFWRVWQSASSFSSARGSFANWMFGIARNLAIDILRRQKRVDFQPLREYADYDEGGLPAHVVTAPEDVAEAAWLRMRQEQIALALDQLPEEQRNIVIWAYFEGKTRREIAAEYDIPLGTVNTRARLALQKLQDLLTTEGFEE